MAISRLVLLGGGHSHVEVIRRLALHPLSGVQVTLVSPDRHAIYSGMLPGWIAGHYELSQCSIDLEALCRAAGARLHRTAANRIDPVARRVQCSDGTLLDYDVLSLNIGSTPDWDTIPGAFEHGVPVKPLARFVQAWHGLKRNVQRSQKQSVIALIGAGAGGVELALAMRFGLGKRPGGDAGPVLHLLTDKSSILSGHAPGAARRFDRILRTRGIAVHLENRVTRIDAGTLHRDREGPLPFDHALLATTAAAPKWLAATGLRTDARGFVLVNTNLQSLSHPDVFAAGDVATIDGATVPKSGVYAVREGPPLAENLRRALNARPLVAYTPQKNSLALISTGDRCAVASWRGLSFAGAWVWRWKDSIDRRFVARYRSNPGRDRVL
ncbi:MAG: FAD-dependent oxidoreductase [Betaproteobacteria bacterium]